MATATPSPFVEPISQLAKLLTGPTNDPVGALGGAQYSPRVIMGPVESSAGPLAYTQSAQLSTATAKGIGYKSGIGTLSLPSPFFRVMSVPAAAGEFYVPTPGGELVSAAPGAADLWRDLIGGSLPTLRAAGQEHSVSSGGGFTGAANLGGAPLGAVSAGLGGWGLIIVGGGLLAWLLIRKRR